jgi:hypothetical protein
MEQNQTTKKRPLAALLGYILGAVVSAAIGYWIAQYLDSSRLPIRYSEPIYLPVYVGQNQVVEGLTYDIGKVTYKSQDYLALRVVQLQISNYSSRTLKSGAQFLIVDSALKPLPESAIVDVLGEQLNTPGGNRVGIKREDISGMGPGFRSVGDLPSGAALQVTVIVDANTLPSLKKTGLVIQKVAREGETFEPQQQSGIQLSLSGYIFSLIAAAVVYVFLLTVINYRMLHNYGFGSQLIDRVAAKLLGREIMRPLNDWLYYWGRKKS